MDLTNAIEAEQSSSTEATSNDDTETEIPFEPNETTEGYFGFSESDPLVSTISTDVFGNDPVYGLVEWDDTLEDYEDKDTDHLSGQQKLDLLHKLTKGTFGDMQSELNEGYGMGWDRSGEGPPTIYDNDEVNHVPYFDVYPDFTAFEMDTLTPDEIDQLEAEGVNIDNFGSMDHIEGPVIPVIDGERVPILYEDGDEVVRFLEMMDSIDWDEVTYCPKDGELQGTPTLGPSEGDSNTEDQKAPGVESDGSETVNLAANPERVTEMSVSDLRSGPNNVTNIDSLRTIETMLRAEQEQDESDIRSSVVKRLNERRNALQGQSEDDENDTEDTNGASDGNGSETVESVDSDTKGYEWVVTKYGFNQMEQDALRYRVESGKNETYEEAAKEMQMS